ncbi:MAG TPA: hypothetical protein VJ965_07100 [Anaerolineales bacterium]|nr:hypothetical protein [Anaerolineales bacterium]
MEDKKKVGLIVTIVTVFLCGCPGLCGLVFGAMTLTGAGNYSGNISPGAFGGGLLCGGIFFILIPVAAGVYTLVQRNKAAEVEDVDVPPAI